MSIRRADTRKRTFIFNGLPVTDVVDTYAEVAGSCATKFSFPDPSGLSPVRVIDPEFGSVLQGILRRGYSSRRFGEKVTQAV